MRTELSSSKMLPPKKFPSAGGACPTVDIDPCETPAIQVIPASGDLNSVAPGHPGDPHMAMYRFAAAPSMSRSGGISRISAVVVIKPLTTCPAVIAPPAADCE